MIKKYSTVYTPPPCHSKNSQYANNNIYHLNAVGRQRFFSGQG